MKHKKLVEGSTEKVTRTKKLNLNDVNIKITYSFNLLAVFKNTFFLVKTNVFVDKGL